MQMAEKDRSEAIHLESDKSREQDLRQPQPQATAGTALFVGDPEAAEEREMLFAYQAAHPELEPYVYYMNGYPSAENSKGNTRYDPDRYRAFPRLMQDVSAGKVSCIVVSSLVCFALGYLDTVYYIQNVFRYLNVRFIAVKEDFDSAREEDIGRISVRTSTIISEKQSQKLSKLRCEQARKRAEQPDAKPPGSAPYGYQLKTDKTMYQPDPQTAPKVRMIFHWALMGLSCGQIAERMTVLGEPTPGQLRNGKAADPSGWKAYVVLKILQNPNYTGDMHIGRMQQAKYRSESRHSIDADDWIVHKNTHEPLTTRQDYEKVQELIARKSKREKSMVARPGHSTGC